MYFQLNETEHEASFTITTYPLVPRIVRSLNNHFNENDEMMK